MMAMQEKQHRLPRENYLGEITAAFTLCVHDKKQIFQDSAIIEAFIEHLYTTVDNSHCIVPVYCIMPDHLHIILTGVQPQADLWKTIVAFKQKTGYWLSRHMPTARWQKDFYDHIIRSEKTIAIQVRYILDNPVRKGLVPSWQEYPYKGAIGCSLDDVLNSIR